MQPPCSSATNFTSYLMDLSFSPNTSPSNIVYLHRQWLYNFSQLKANCKVSKEYPVGLAKRYSSTTLYIPIALSLPALISSSLRLMSPFVLLWLVILHTLPDLNLRQRNNGFKLVTQHISFNQGVLAHKVRSVKGIDLVLQVHCEVRGSLEPPCSAVGLIDQVILGEHHLYQHPAYRRIKECSINSPNYGPLPQNAPGWCLAPNDPEGILSSLMAAITCLDQMLRVLLWSMLSFPLLIAGYVLELLGVPFCKPLYTLSYMCITAGASGLFLTIIFYIVDIKHFRKPTMLLEWMGMNALIVFALAACDLFPAAVDGTESFVQAMIHSEKWGTLVFAMLEILFWSLVAGFLPMKGIYLKL
ncbi:hypothetical protein CFP56_027019 [Quercus suber]|uniref:Uncharacterized protein n=1 Tax=Quercus suber TaxID=58331 RepID=A0AAW0K0A5_QUESU